MAITSAQIKELRDKTGVSIMQCKKALEEADGDLEKAAIILKKKGAEAAAKKSDRELAAGAVGAYIHNTNEVAALVMLSCETDFVAKNEEFVALAREIAMQVAATNPAFVSRDDVDASAHKKVEEVLQEEVKDKPADLKEKILSGKLDAYFKEQVLLEQPFIKDDSRTIGDLINGAVQKFGENIAIAKVSRLSVR